MASTKELEALRERLREDSGFPEQEWDENGRSILHMTVRDDSGFLSPYCGEKPIISSEVADYLDNAAAEIPPKKQISLRIRSNVITDEEARVYDSAIRNFYRNRSHKSNRDLLRSRIAAIAMLVAGILVFSVLFILETRGIGEMLTSLLEIAAWVFVWEAVDLFFLEHHRLMTEHRLYQKFVNADIRFLKIK